MHYTDKEKKGIDKVDRMNKLFDKVLMPVIGVIIILTLLSFIVGKLMDKFGGGESEGNASVSVSSSVSGNPNVFDTRAALLANYETYAEAFAAYGYAPAEGYTQDLSLRKQVDEELVIYQFSDSAMGDFTILKYTPSAADAAYQSLSLTVSSASLINASARGGDFNYTVAFTSTDFSSYRKDDGEEYNALMKVVSPGELTSMYEIFEADIENLAESCGISEK